MGILAWWQRRKARREAVRVLCVALKLHHSTGEKAAMLMGKLALASSEMRGIEVPKEVRVAVDTLSRG